MTISTMDEKLYLGTDLGTTHIKSAIFREDGTLVELIKASTPIAEDQYGQIYHPIPMYDIVRDQIAILLEQYPKIDGISVTGMAEAGLIINRRTLKEETAIIPWFDRRTVALSTDVSEEQERHYFYSTGLRNSYKYGIYKFLWLLQHGKIEKNDALWLSACDYITWKLTGQFVTDPSFAARTYVYDIVRRCWDQERLVGYGLTTDNFPKVLPSGEAAGYLSEPLLLHKSQNKSIIVCIGGHDHICAAYAVLNNDRERICNSVGTAETYLGIAKGFINKEELYHSGMVYGPFINGSEYYWMGNVPASGQSVEWFRKDMQHTEISYDEMNEKLSMSAEEPTDIIFLPYLSGIGTPYFLPEVSGALIGLRAAHDRWDMLKAILEGVNYQGKLILSLVPEEVVVEQKEVICVGGAAESEPWMRIKANILGLPVKIPKVAEATLLGAVAILLQRNYGLEHRQRFLDAYQQYNKEYQVDRRVYELYQEVFQNRYTVLIDSVIKQERSKKV